MQSWDVSVAALPEIRQGNELIEEAITAAPMHLTWKASIFPKG
nr:hypothetical protein [uncultured Desulfobacter sp.]